MPEVAIRVAVPIGMGEFTGVVQIWADNPEELYAKLESLGEYVEDVSLRATRGEYSPLDMGFDVQRPIKHCEEEWCECWFANGPWGFVMTPQDPL